MDGGWRLGLAALAVVWLSACSRPDHADAVAEKDEPESGRDAGPGEAVWSPKSARSSGGDRPLILPVEVPGAGDLDGKAATALWERWRRAIEADGDAAKTDRSGRARARLMLEQIVLNDAGIPSSIMRKIRPYAEAYLVNGGPVDRQTGRRLRPTFIPGELAWAAQAALANGAVMDLPETRGADLGANRVEELEALLKVVRPEIFGERGVATEAADAGADEGADDIEKEAGSRLSGTVVGFVPARWARIVAQVEKRAAALDRKARAVGGEKSVAPRVVRARVEPIVAVDATGDFGPAMPAGTDLLWSGPIAPLDGGARLIFALNADEALEAAIFAPIVREFSFDEAVAGRRLGCRPANRVALQMLREIAGRGLDGTERKPQGWLAGRLGEAHAVIDELRADLAALYLAPDPSVIGSGLVRDEECALALYEDYASGALEMAAAGRDGADPGYAARAAVVAHLLRAGAASLERGEETPRTTFRIIDLASARRAIEGLLAEVRRIRFAGDGKAARELIARSSGWLPADAEEELGRRWSALGVPRSVAFLYPLPGGAPAGSGGLALDRPSDPLDRLARLLALRAMR